MLLLPVLALAVLATAASDDDNDRRTVRLVAAPSDEVIVSPTIDQLDDGDVLVVRVTDGTPGASGAVRQCTATVSGFAGCSNTFPVLFDDAGTATFQYQVVDPGECDGATACAVVVDDEDGERRAVVFTVFGATAPPAPTVTVTPPGPFEPGDEVRLDVASLTPGAVVRTAFCAERCGPATVASADDGGRAATTVTIGDRCADCNITVVAGASSTRVAVRFGPPPSPDYGAQRLVIGLAAAAAFLVAAWRIITSVDWRPPSEAEVADVDVFGPA